MKQNSLPQPLSCPMCTKEGVTYSSKFLCLCGNVWTIENGWKSNLPNTQLPTNELLTDIAARPDQTIVAITNRIFNAIKWEKHYTVKERQALNDVVDEIIAKATAKAEQKHTRELREDLGKIYELIEIVKGIGCETCFEERVFGHPPDNSPGNLYLYQDLVGNTRCYCRKHMSYFNKAGAILKLEDEWDFVGYGAKLMSEIISLTLNNEEKK